MDKPNKRPEKLGNVRLVIGPNRMFVTTHELEFDDEVEFLAYLRLSEKHWRGSHPPAKWAFRGQPDASLPLVPSVFRTGKARPKLFDLALRAIHARHFDHLKEISEAVASKDVPDGASSERVASLMVHVLAETELLARFAGHAADVGHPVPDYINLLEWQARTKAALAKPVKSFASRRELGPILSSFLSSTTVLAQHHGIPTRLTNGLDVQPFGGCLLCHRALQPLLRCDRCMGIGPERSTR